MTTVVNDDRAIFARRESEARSYCRSFPTVFTSARGALMKGADGREYIDFLAGCSSLNYGHNDPVMKQALVDYITADGVTHGLDMHTDAKARFLESFEERILRPRGMDHRMMFMGPTGANAVEAAMKIARKATGRTNVIAFTNGFHGVTLGALAATGNGYHRGGAGMGLTGVTRMPYDGSLGDDVDTAEMLDTMLSNPSSGIEAPAAIILEVVQGEGGLNAARPEWVKRIAEIARAHGALLIIDDIQAGCGRTGGFFSFDGMDVKPDLVTMAKSLSGFGLPLAAVLVRPEHDVLGPAEHNGTFRGNNHAFVTARAALETYWADDAFREGAEARAILLEESLTRVSKRIPGSRLKGRGMMRGVDVGSGELASEICKACFAEGLIIETSGAHDEVVKVLAPLNIDLELFKRGLDILEEAVEQRMESTRIAAE